MPGGDGTGPQGNGPMTGRGTGFCAGYSMPGYSRDPGRYRAGGNRNRGRSGLYGPGGHRNRFYSTGMPGWMRYGNESYDQSVAKDSELHMLRNQSEYLKNALDNIDRRMKELEAEEE